MAAMDVGIVSGLVAVGVLFGGTFGFLVGTFTGRADMARQRPIVPPRDAAAPLLTDAFMADLLTRLVDVSLPKAAQAREPDVEVVHEGEYEEPMADVADWTDSIPELTPQRPDWVGVAPGEGVPGMVPRYEFDPANVDAAVTDWREKGEEMFASWVQPVDLGDGEIVE